jgi:hypothetical protein
MRGKTVIFIGDNKMKKLFFGTLLLALVIVVPVPTMVSADVNVSIALPPPIIFAAPPELVVLPETYVYVVPDSDADIFFYNGWWWRPWEGRWYRSQYYDSGWAYYQSVPSFYAEIPSGWRNDYREHRWRGQQWNYQRISHKQVQQNWKGWEKSKHWEKQQTWGVQGLKPQVRSQQPARKIAKPQQSRPQSREAAKPQSRKVAKPQQSKSQQGKPERGEEEKRDRK